MTIVIVTVALVAGAFLLIINIPDGPLESLRQSPSIGRFGQIFNTEYVTNQVRILIWQGAAEMVAPHEPLEYPDGSKDSFNVIRPLIG